MATACIAHGVFRVHGISQTIVAKFDQPHASSDGGAASTGYGVHARLLRARRHGEPAQRTAARGGHGSHELLALRRQPAAAVVLRRGLRPVPDVADCRAPHRTRRGAGLDVARATREGRGLGRTVGPAPCPALAPRLRVARSVVPTGSCARGHVTPATAAGAARPRWSCLSRTRASAHAAAPRPVTGGAIVRMPPRAIVSIAEHPTQRSLEPFRSLVSAFTNSPG